MFKRILIISYYWPPSGGGGVQRWLKLSKYLPKSIIPVIYTPSNPPFVIKDTSLLRDIRPHMEVWKKPIKQPHRCLFKKKIKAYQGVQQGHPLIRFLGANLFIPDSKILWKKDSLNFLLGQLKKTHIDLLISTGPPHSMHLLAEEIKKKTKIPWIADFRDNWTDWEVIQELPLLPLIRRRHHKLEKRVVQTCDGLITISPNWSQKFREKGAQNVFNMPNGFDPEDIPNPFPKAPKQKFRLVHMGMLNLKRSHSFWKALNSLMNSYPEIKTELEITLGGEIAEDLKDFLYQESDLYEKVKYIGYVKHQEVFKNYAQGHVNLVFSHTGKDAQGHIPGKLLECLAIPRPLLFLGDPQGDASQVLNKYPNPYIHITQLHQVQDIQHALLELFQKRHTNISTQAIENLKSYNRQYQAENLARWINNIQKPKT
ncbi:MAG: glycosyl transferase [Cytophagales bacterium]|nr:glycosyl transferase [Cytophagales bacterium]